MWMSDAFAEMMLGHLVCLIQCNAFILVEWAYLGRGKLRWPVLWAELLCMGEMGLSLAAGMSFFNVQSVLLNVLYLFVTAQLFGGNFADKLTACLINGTMCLLVENTVNYTYSWFTGVRTGEAWQHPGCLIALCAANLIVGAAVAHFLYSWNQKCALQPLQALVMSFFPGVAVVLNIVLMVTGTQQPATRMTMLLTFGMSVAVLVHIAIVQMFNDQVVQRQNSRYRAQLEQQRAEALLDSYTEQRRLTHEFTNHMSALSALLDQDDLKGARTYLASVSKTVAAGTTIMDTHNPLLDSILSKKYDRGYVERDQKKLKPTLLGRAVDGLMLEQFPHIVDVDFSAQMEKNLDKIESGKADWHKTVDDFYQGFAASLEQAEKNMEGKKVKVPDEPSSEVCDLCGRPMVIKVGKYGKFLACSGFPECRGTKRLVKDTGGICPKCGKGRMLERKSSKGRIYYGCERYPDCDFMTWDMPVPTKCPKCGSTMFRKGSKLYCAKEGCGYEMPVPKKD